MIRGSLDKPGFLRCQVVWQVWRRSRWWPWPRLESRKIPPVCRCRTVSTLSGPQKAKLAQVPAKATLMASKRRCRASGADVQVACVETGFRLLRPTGRGQANLRPCCTFTGGRAHVIWCGGQRARQGMLGMDINAHGIPNGKPAAFTRSQQGRVEGVSPQRPGRPREVYFLGMFLR